MPDESILAHGTTEPLADATTQARHAAHMPASASGTPPPGDWDLIDGELITFPDPTRNLPPLDHLEGFRPDRSSLYQRVLVPISYDFCTSTAWVYAMHGPLRGQLLAEGRWPR